MFLLPALGLVNNWPGSHREEGAVPQGKKGGTQARREARSLLQEAEWRVPGWQEPRAQVGQGHVALSTCGASANPRFSQSLSFFICQVGVTVLAGWREG